MLIAFQTQLQEKYNNNKCAKKHKMPLVTLTTQQTSENLAEG